MIGADAPRRDRPTPLTIDHLVVATFALFGLRLGLRQLSDNSGFTHLATGVRMVRHGLVPAIPRVDPYTFTAHGQRWVVQSWLPEAFVGWVYRLVGEHGVTILGGLTMAVLAWVVAAMARTGRPERTALAAGAALLVGVPFWTPRPLLVGLLCLAATILIVERKRSPWWLVPIVWIWVNSHGSFPLGLLWIGAVVVGGWLDRERPSLRYLGAFVAGLALSVLNPLGPRLLLFAGTALTKHEVFKTVVEWRSTDFQSGEGLVALVGLGLTLAVLSRHRQAWRDLVPAVAFLVLGLSAQRNLAPLGIVLAPILGRALAAPAREASSGAVNRVFGVVLGGIAAVFLLGALGQPLVSTSTYPLRSIKWLERHHRFDQPHRVATNDITGNYLELRHGPRREVFIDDRVDLFSLRVSNDYAAMLNGTNRGVRALERWHVDTLLWHAHTPLADRLVASGEWKRAAAQPGWVVLLRQP